MQDNNTWSSSTQEHNYGPTNYSYSTSYTTNGNTPTPSTLMPLSQPNTPRPEASLPVAREESNTDNGHRKTRTPGRASSFSTTSFQSNPYPTSPIRRRRTESTMFTFETGPTFSGTKQFLDIWNMDQTNGYQLQIHVKMDRGFFRAEQDWTCYRRNYFQVSATFDVHGITYLTQGSEVPCLVQSEQRLFQVDYFSIGVSACVSGSEKKVDLIQHTPKRDKGPQMIPQPRALRSGGNLHLAPVGSNHNIVTFERMQFKTATANNGKRRAAQQYYEIVVDLYANTADGHSLRVACCTSAPLVVRGRSPGHYADFHSRYRDNASPASSDPTAAAAAAAVTVGVNPMAASPYGPPQAPNLGSLPSQHSLDDRYQQGPSRFMGLPASPSHDFGSYQSYPPPFYPPIIPPPPPSLQSGTSTSTSSSSPTSSARSGFHDSDYVVPSSNYARSQHPSRLSQQQQPLQQGYYQNRATLLTSPTTEDRYSTSTTGPGTRPPMIYNDQPFKSTLSSPDVKPAVINQPQSSSSTSSSSSTTSNYYTDQYNRHQHTQHPHHRHVLPSTHTSSTSSYVDSSITTSYASYSANDDNNVRKDTTSEQQLSSYSLDKSPTVDAGRPNE